MQRCFLVSNKTTQVQQYLEHRSIIEVTEEHRSLSELDLAHLGIVDVDKFIYIYYGSDDGDLAFRSDLNILRQLLASPFFNTSEGIFILVDCQNPMLEDLIHSACRDTNLIGTKLEVIHHSNVLTLNDVSKYITGTTFGTNTNSTYKNVYIKEADLDERERYSNDSTGIDTVLPVLTDQYTMYCKRAEVEAISSSRQVFDSYTRLQILRDFTKLGTPTVHRWNTFLLSGELYTKFPRGTNNLLDYFKRVGIRCLVIDLTHRMSSAVAIPDARHYTLSELSQRGTFSEQAALIKCRYNQLGYVIEMLDNIEGANRHIFVCDSEDYCECKEYLAPLCNSLYTNYVTHYAEDAVQDYLALGVKSTTLFLSTEVRHVEFDLFKYKEDFAGQRVALFGDESVDTTDFYECAIGGGDN